MAGIGAREDEGMKRSRFSEEQIVRAIQEYDQGKKAEDICREMGWDFSGRAAQNKTANP
jgi:hypothetical protein